MLWSNSIKNVSLGQAHTSLNVQAILIWTFEPIPRKFKVTDMLRSRRAIQAIQDLGQTLKNNCIMHCFLKSSSGSAHNDFPPSAPLDVLNYWASSFFYAL